MAGLPHSEIRGSKGARPSPRLIAACYVLHRLSVPRHPPNALIALDRSKPKTSHLTTGPLKTDRHHKTRHSWPQDLYSALRHILLKLRTPVQPFPRSPSFRTSERARTLATRKDPVFVRSFRSLIHNDKQPCPTDDPASTAVLQGLTDPANLFLMEPASAYPTRRS